MNDSLSTRMKKYEYITRRYLTSRVPVIVRVDGKAFHSLTRKHFTSGYDSDFNSLMQAVSMGLVQSIQGCNLAYSQSDEISLLLTDYKTINTHGHFGYNLDKIISTIPSLASSLFTVNSNLIVQFDARAFSIPKDEVCNYFIWRQQDATRNAIQMTAQQNYSHKQLHGLSCNELQDKLFKEKNINFDALPTVQKRGFCIKNQDIDTEIPIFTKNREYIENEVYIRED